MTDHSKSVTSVQMVAPLTWEDIIDRCSRLHTTKTKPRFPWEPDGEQREASDMIDAFVAGRPVQIVPTRMHEPGFYWRWMDEMEPIDDGRLFPKIMRSPEDIELLHRYADMGEVTL